MQDEYMIPTFFRCAVCLLLAFLLAPAARGEPESQADLQAMFDAGHYSQLLPKLNKALALKGPSASGYDHYKLLILKGETQLRTPSGKAAVETFRTAALTASTPDEAAVDRATAILINRSGNGKFTPKKTASNAKPAAIGIVESSDRKQAFDALFAEMMDTAKPDLDRSEQITSLPPLIDIAKKVGEIRPVDIAATGSDDRSKEALKPLADHAGTLMTDALTKLDTQVGEVDKAAAKRLKQLRSDSPAMKKEALGPDAVGQLQTLANQAKQISAYSQQLQPTFGDAGDFKAVETAATKTIDKINEVLKKYEHPAISQ